MAIKFTQYLLPDGQRKTVYVPRSPEIEAKANELIREGIQFEAKILTTGELWLTAYDPHEEDTIAGKIVKNTPNNGSAIDEIVNEAHELWFSGRS